MKRGFSQVYALKGGYREWAKAQWPLEMKFVKKQDCLTCHAEFTPRIVSDWRLSKHSENEVTCSTCHDDHHTSSEDVAKVVTFNPEKCGMCHEERWEQFKAGKHAKAWVAMKAMPTAHWQPMALMEGMKGCGGCHRLGIKTEAEIKALSQGGKGFGLASCDVCHTRHTFSAMEARQPQACQTCHMGFDHPQWEMYSSSKHGVRYLLKQLGVLPDGAAAPTCQTCHMQEGSHEVRTAWGFFGLGPSVPEDKAWTDARIAIFQALGMLDPEGKPTARQEVMKEMDVMRLTQEAWDKERVKMLTTCGECHSLGFAKAELMKGDQMIREADLLMGQAIHIVAGLYKDQILQRPRSYRYPFPDLLSFHDAPSPVEQRLFLMFMKHRMRTFQGAFHANPDFTFWYGWSEMQQDLTEIKAMAEELRRGSR